VSSDGTSPSIFFEHRMSDADALMWNLEKDPLLRSTITVLWLLDRSPERDRFDEKIERTTRTIPRLRQRVVGNPLSLAPPRWEVDPNFDLAFHCRYVKAPGDGSLRGVLDLAQPIAMQGFDRARPLWELWVVEGLEDGRAALIMKLHHSLSDGVGLVQMTSSLVERYRDVDPTRAPKPMPLPPVVHVMNQRERFWDALAHERRRRLGQTRRSLAAVARAVRNPLAAAREVSQTVPSLARMLRPVAEPLSPIMRRRSLRLRFDTIMLSLPRLKAASKTVNGTLNDAFVAGVAGGLARYHAAHGRRVPTLRMTMPINVRDGEGAARAGNQFAPARFPVPLDIADPVARMRTIRGLVGRQRAEPALGLLDEISGLLNRLPTSVLTVLFGSMLKGIDFVTSNVPGPRLEVFVSGARIEAIYGFGPLSGAAANITVFSYLDQLGVAVATDRAAVPDPALLVECLEAGFAEVLAATGA
jgi:WS/DGAT/MGAT family acyltransferase